MEKLKVNKLKKGDTIGVIAPSNSIDNDDKEFIQKSCKLFEDLGLVFNFLLLFLLIDNLLSCNPI